MKKVFIIVLLFAALVMTGCGEKTDQKTLKVDLESNPTTGYTWTYSLSSDDILKETKNEYVQDENSKHLTGAGGTQKYEFVALKEGEATINFVYSRPWETDENANPNGEIYTLKIDKDLNITIISIEKWPE